MSHIFESALCARCGVAEARCGTPGSKGYCFPCFPVAQREEWEAERLAAQEASPGPPSGKNGRARGSGGQRFHAWRNLAGKRRKGR